MIREKAGQTDTSVDYAVALASKGVMRCNSYAGRNFAFIVLEKL